MRPYWAAFSARFRLMLQYRAAAVAGAITQTWFGLILVAVYEAFFRSSTATMPMTLEETVAYVWLGQALFMLGPWVWDRELVRQFRAGDIVYELARPVDVYWFWYARAVALRSASAMLRSVPVVIVAVLIGGLPAPACAASGAAFAVAVVSATLLSSAVMMLVNVSYFWTISGEGIARALPAVTALFSGLLIPLPFFPDWLQPLVKALPFRGIYDIPFRLYLGHIEPLQAPAHLAQQIVWTLVIMALGRFLMVRAMRSLVVQGG